MKRSRFWIAIFALLAVAAPSYGAKPVAYRTRAAPRASSTIYRPGKKLAPNLSATKLQSVPGRGKAIVRGNPELLNRQVLNTWRPYPDITQVLLDFYTMNMVIAKEELRSPQGSTNRIGPKGGRALYDARQARTALIDKYNPQFLELLVHTVALELSMIPPGSLGKDMEWLKQANARSQAPAAERVLTAAEKANLSVRDFAKTAVQTFQRTGRWEKGGKAWGGESWAKIANAILQYDELDAVTWLDHVFDLQHNNGAVFSGKRLAFKPTAAKALLDYKNKPIDADPADFLALAEKFDLRASPSLAKAVATREGARSKPRTSDIVWFEDVGHADTGIVGGKGANLGEMRGAGLPVPRGYVVTVNAFRKFLAENEVGADLQRWLGELDVRKPAQVKAISEKIQNRIRNAPIPDSVRSEIEGAYAKLGKNAPVAVRSSGTVEDGADASFAGMFRSHLNVRGVDELTRMVKDDWASAFGERALLYAKKRSSADLDQLVAVVVMKMVRSEKSGVLFMADPTSGKTDRLVIESTRGLGEAVVSGEVVPDRVVLSKGKFKVLEERKAGDGKNALTVPELKQLSALAAKIESHYGTPQDMEFGFERGKVYPLQTRPITKVEKAASSTGLIRQDAKALVHGIRASSGTVTGRVRIVHSAADADSFKDGEILVADMTLPDWVPLMMRAKAIVTNNGGLISHAAIVARELGVPAIVGAQDATAKLRDGMIVTVDGQSGTIYQGDARSKPGHTMNLEDLLRQPSVSQAGLLQMAMTFSSWQGGRTAAALA